MTDTILPDQILKRDVLGRVRTPRSRRESLLDEFERSGLSGQKFAALVGIKYQTFATWLQKRRRPASGAKPKETPDQNGKTRWLEAVIEKGGLPPSHGNAGVILELPGRARLRISGREQIDLAAALLRALEAPSC